MNNPFPYTEDNKRYYTWNYYGKNRFGNKIAKIPLDGGFTCPNRDGTLDSTGCLFCPSHGGNNYPIPSQNDLWNQFESRLAIIQRKWPEAIPVPYFQSYSNTYGPMEKIQNLFEPFLNRKEIPMIFLATRVDCLNDEVLSYLHEVSLQKELWIELGVQSIHDETTKMFHCHHTFAQAKESILKLHDLGINISVHLINGFPNENKEMMLESVREISKLPIQAIKFHALLLLKDSPLSKTYPQNPFPLLTKEEYADIVIDQLELLPQEVVIERVTSDAPEDELIEPKWVIQKTNLLNYIDQEMVRRNTYQGRKYETS